jgi:hypothetical protein
MTTNVDKSSDASSSGTEASDKVSAGSGETSTPVASPEGPDANAEPDTSSTTATPITAGGEDDVIAWGDGTPITVGGDDQSPWDGDERGW